MRVGVRVQALVDPLRIAAGLATLAVGAIHLKLYFDSYRDIPIANIGRGFLFNAVAALGAAIALVLWPHRAAAVPALLLANATLVGFGLSRSDGGFFEFTELGWNPTPWAAASVFAEIAAAVFATALLATSAMLRSPAAQDGV